MTSTPLERHREANADPGALAAIRADLLVAYKSDERARFCGTVTDWEFHTYAEAVP
jgi:glutamine synthetase